MHELHSHAETTEIKKLEAESFGRISSELKTAFDEAKSYVREIFEQPDRHYVSYEDRLDRTPIKSERGEWNGDPGESKFIPSGDTELSLAAKEKLADYGLDGIEYKDAEPDFSKCSEATVKIDHMTENRYDYDDEKENRQMGNFSQADMKCAEQWNTENKDERSSWTASEIRDWRIENKLTWHECCDTETMQLVPREIHEFFNHSGGVAECKTRDASNNGGGFDE